VLEINDVDTAKDVRKRIAKKAGVSPKGTPTMDRIRVDTKYLPSHGNVLTVEPLVVEMSFWLPRIRISSSKINSFHPALFRALLQVPLFLRP
jgi:hypothetical protein